jgi:hypothetical protein
MTVISEKNDVFDKLNEPIISSLTKNKYFAYLKKLTNENINRTDLSYRQNLLQVDSLRNVYMKVMLLQANNPSIGTNIDLAGENVSNKETELFFINKRINEDLEEIAKDKTEKYEVINVISNFQSIGQEIKGVTKNYGFLLSALCMGLMILFLLLLKLNKFLDNYKK